MVAMCMESAVEPGTADINVVPIPASAFADANPDVLATGARIPPAPPAVALEAADPKKPFDAAVSHAKPPAGPTSASKSCGAGVQSANIKTHGRSKMTPPRANAPLSPRLTPSMTSVEEAFDGPPVIRSIPAPRQGSDHEIDRRVRTRNIDLFAEVAA